MGHGHGLLALVLKLYFVLLLAQVALAETSGQNDTSQASEQQTPGSSSAPGTSSSNLSQSSPSSTFSSTASFPSSSSPSSTHIRHFSDSKPTTDDSTSAPLTNSTVPPSTTEINSTTIGNTPDVTPGPPTDTSVSTPTDSASEMSPSAANAVLASSHSNHRVPIIAGVVAPVALIILAAVGFVLYKRRQRAADRREWERTHEAIADAVRQVGSPVPGRTITPYAGSGAWSHLDMSAKGSGDTVTNPYTDRPVSHQSADHSALPVFRAVHSPTFRVAHSPSLSQTYYPFPVQDEPEPESRPASTTESSIQVDTSYGHHDSHDSQESHAI